MGAVVPWFERRSLSSLREIGDFPLAVRTLRVLTTSRKLEIFERPRLGVQTWRPIDILLGLKGEDSHARTALRWVGSFRFVEGPGPCQGFNPSRSGLHWPCQVAGTPLLETTGPVVSWGLRRSSDSEVPVSLPVPTYPNGVPSGFGRMHPSLSDCPGRGADVPRRIPKEMRGGHLRPRLALKVNDDGDSSPPSRAGISPYNHVNYPALLAPFRLAAVGHSLRAGLSRTAIVPRGPLRGRGPAFSCRSRPRHSTARLR